MRLPVYVVSCYSDRSRILCHRRKDGIILLLNSYLTSFLDNIALLSLVAANYPDNLGESLDAETLAHSFAKKLVSEQMYVIQPSRMARVLFLETMLAFEGHWRRLVELRTVEPCLRDSSLTYTRLASDFLLHHELGHVAAKDDRFCPFTNDVVEAYLAETPIEEFSGDDRHWFSEEASADLFGLNCCIARYAPSLSEETLRTYLIYVARSVTAFNVLYLWAADLHRINVADEVAPSSELSIELLHWAHREALMCRYLNGFEFGEERVICAVADQKLELKIGNDQFAPFWSAATLHEPPDDSSRRLAEVIANGFDDGADFSSVISSVRSPWLLNTDADES